MPNNRKVQANRQLYKSLHYRRYELHRLFRFLDQQEKYRVLPGELSIVFLSDNAIARLHADYLDDPSPTDVITFPGDPEMEFAGEICVSVERALREAPLHGNTFANELTLYLVHGWLHLAGLDDRDETSRAAMREGESFLMQRLTENNHIPSFNIPDLK